jgi:hypothetical protein
MATDPDDAWLDPIVNGDDSEVATWLTTDDNVAIFQHAAAAHLPAREQGSAPPSWPPLCTPLCRPKASMASNPNDAWLNRIVNGDNPEFDALINRLPNEDDFAMAERTLLQASDGCSGRGAQRVACHDAASALRSLTGHRIANRPTTT